MGRFITQKTPSQSDNKNERVSRLRPGQHVHLLPPGADVHYHIHASNRQKELRGCKWIIWLRDSLDFGAVLMIPIFFTMFPFASYVPATVFNFLLIIVYFAVYCNEA